MSTTPDYDSPEQRYSYRSKLVDRLRGGDFEFRGGRLTIRLARKFGFCWGVDRAVALVLDAVRDHPGRRIWLLNQIIHNPRVNEDLLERGVGFLFGRYAGQEGLDQVGPDDVVVIPAFSAEVPHLERLREIGCRIVDTTCPWVEKPHRRVLRYLEEGFTVIVHGLRRHDETRSTCSLVNSRQGHYVVVRDHDEADVLCDFLGGRIGADELCRRLSGSFSPGFDPDRDLRLVGMINQTTMLASESREIARRVADAIRQRDGEDSLQERFRDFDTICPATQDNQDAVIALSTESRPDVFLVLGGYDSSNTRNLLRSAEPRHGGYHIQDPASIEADVIHHRDPETGEEEEAHGWLPEGAVVVALSAGASTPDTELAEVVLRLCDAAGVERPRFESEVGTSERHESTSG